MAYYYHRAFPHWNAGLCWNGVMNNIAHDRRLLTDAHNKVRYHFPRMRPWYGAWTHNPIGNAWEFHGPNNFKWHGFADNAYDCRYQGWMAWLKHKRVKV